MQPCINIQLLNEWWDHLKQEDPFKSEKSIEKMRMNPLTSFTIKITLNVQYNKKNNATHLQ